MWSSNVNKNIEFRASSKTALRYVKLMTYHEHSATEHSAVQLLLITEFKRHDLIKNLLPRHDFSWQASC